jgi:hypothetical protein
VIINWNATKYRPDYDDAIALAVKRDGIEGLNTPNAEPTFMASFLASLYRVSPKVVVHDMRAKHFEYICRVEAVGPRRTETQRSEESNVLCS